MLLQLLTASLASSPCPHHSWWSALPNFCRGSHAVINHTPTNPIPIYLRVVCSACGHAEPVRSGRTRCLSATWQGVCLEGHTYLKPQVAPLCPWADSNACSRYFTFQARWHFPFCTCSDLSWYQWELQVHSKTATNFMFAENFERVKLSFYCFTCLLPWMTESVKGWHQHVSRIVAALSTRQGIHIPLAFLISCRANNSTAFCYLTAPDSSIIAVLPQLIC